MIATLSPAKTLDYETPLPPLTPTRPRFAAEAETLAKAASHLTQKKLAALMKISPALAKLNADRFRDFADAPERPALFAFAGDVPPPPPPLHAARPAVARHNPMR